MQGNFERMGEGATGQTELKRQLISESALVLPQKELIDEFSSTVMSGRALIQTLLKKNENLSEQRDMLLPKLISGDIKVN